MFGRCLPGLTRVGISGITLYQQCTYYSVKVILISCPQNIHWTRKPTTTAPGGDNGHTNDIHHVSSNYNYPYHAANMGPTSVPSLYFIWKIPITVRCHPYIDPPTHPTPICLQKAKIAWPAPSHYLNQCWIIVNWTLRHKLQWNPRRTSFIFIQEEEFENVVCEGVSI